MRFSSSLRNRAENAYGTCAAGSVVEAAEDRMKWGCIVLPIVYKRMWQWREGRREETERRDPEMTAPFPLEKCCLALHICASHNHNLIQDISPLPLNSTCSGTRTQNT